MANSFIIGISLLVIAGICVQYAFVRRHRSFRTNSEEEAFEKFEKDVEWQLQHELSDAIEASNVQVREKTPLPFSSDDKAPHITFADTQPSPGSWQDYKAYSRAELDRLPSPTASLDQVDGLPIHAVEDYGINSTPLYINPKQFHRILKRRMARHVMEEYFRSRIQPNNLSQQNERLRRPRGPNGRFLTLDEVARISNAPNGVVLA